MSYGWWEEWVGMIFGSRDAWRRWAMAAIRKQETDKRDNEHAIVLQT
jgi:hypothetical protein